MTHFGILCPDRIGHLNPMMALGNELQRRGHRATLFGTLDSEANALSAGLSFRAIGELDYPIGTAAELMRKRGMLSGLAALRYEFRLAKQETVICLRDSPKAIRLAGVEALLVDQVVTGGSTVAEILGLPFISVCSALLFNIEDSVPPPFTIWSYSSARWTILRNKLGYALAGYFALPFLKVVKEYRQLWKLSSYSKPEDYHSKLAQVSQQPAEFEFPRKTLPECFHFTGPYSNPTIRKPVVFPFEKLTNRVLVYASLGTVQNRLIWVFEAIAEACVGLNVQLVISLGGSANPESFLSLPGEPLVVKYAPQLELLQRASLTITHAGLNTTLESLSNGVPMVAIPIANDQLGVAARIAWTGTGEVVPLSQLSAPRLQAAIKRVLAENSYRKNASRLQEAIRRAGGVKRAADIVEQVIFTGKPVVSHNSPT